MNSYLFDIGERARKVSRFVGRVRAELQHALLAEKKARKLSQQEIAKIIGVNRSVINRQLMGTENLTIRRVAELAWAMGWDIEFKLKKASPMEDRQVAHSPVTGGIVASSNITLPLRPLTDEELLNIVKVWQIRENLAHESAVTNDNYGLVEVAA